MDREISASTKRKRLQKRMLQLGITAAVITAVIIVIVNSFQNSLQAKILTIRAIDRGPIEISVAASGKMTPLIEEIVVSPINTRILEVYKNPGDSVEAGEPLLKLELSSVETEYEQKLDEREMMKSKLVQVQVQLNNTISDLRMQQQVKEMQVKQFYTDLQGEQYLNSIGAGTQDKIRRAELNYEEAKLQLSQLEQKIENEQKNAEAELRVQELGIGILDKTLEEKARLLKDARLLSPRKAVLTYINTEIGVQVAEGTKVAVVSDLTRFKINAEIASSYRDKLSLGSKATIKIGDTEVPGTIVTIAPSVANGVINFTVIPDRANHPDFNSGLSADIYVKYGFRQNILRLPVGNYYKYGPGIYKLWIVRDGRAEKREISLGQSGYDYVEVLNGADEGDRIILSDMETYKNKETLKIH